MLTQTSEILSSFPKGIENLPSSDAGGFKNVVIRLRPNNLVKLHTRPYNPAKFAKNSFNHKEIVFYPPRLVHSYLYVDICIYIHINILIYLLKYSLSIFKMFIGNGGRPATAVPLASHPNCNGNTNSVLSHLEKSLNLPNLPKPKVFTRHARQTLMESAASLEKSGLSPENFLFFTGTLPGSTLEACELFSRCSRLFLNAFKQYLRRLNMYNVFHTWEWQFRVESKFLRKDLPPALHLHLVVVIENISEIDVQALGDKFRDKWLSLLEYYSQKYSISLFQKHLLLGGGFNFPDSESVLQHCCKTVQCEKSPASYLSKYVGKDALAGDKSLTGRVKKLKYPLYYPSSWWGISYQLKNLIQNYSASFIITLPASQVTEFYLDIETFLAEYSTIRLPIMSPDGFNEYTYQNVYIQGDLYMDIKYILAGFFESVIPTDKPTNSNILPTNLINLEWIFHPFHDDFRREFEASLSRDFYYQYCSFNGCLDYMASEFSFPQNKIIYPVLDLLNLYLFDLTKNHYRFKNS